MYLNCLVRYSHSNFNQSLGVFVRKSINSCEAQSVVNSMGRSDVIELVSNLTSWVPGKILIQVNVYVNVLTLLLLLLLVYGPRLWFEM